MAGFLTTAQRKALTDWVTARAPGLKVMWADQDAPAPATTYVTLRPATSTSIGEDYEGAPNDQGVMEVVGNREWMLYMQAFGKGALDALQLLRDTLRLPSVQAAFEAAGFAFIDAERVENLTQLIGQNMNERGALDVRFRGNSSLTDTVGLIENVDITATLSDPIDSVEIEINVGA